MSKGKARSLFGYIFLHSSLSENYTAISMLLTLTSLQRQCVGTRQMTGPVRYQEPWPSGVCYDWWLHDGFQSQHSFVYPKMKPCIIICSSYRLMAFLVWNETWSFLSLHAVLHITKKNHIVLQDYVRQNSVDIAAFPCKHLIRSKPELRWCRNPHLFNQNIQIK